MKNGKAFSNDGANIQLVKTKGTNYEKVKLPSSVSAEKTSKEDFKSRRSISLFHHIYMQFARVMTKQSFLMNSNRESLLNSEEISAQEGNGFAKFPP